MLIILQDEFNTIPLGYIDHKIYNRIRKKFVELFNNEEIADKFLASCWKYSLRELSCNSMVNFMDCFVIL